MLGKAFIAQSWSTDFPADLKKARVAISLLTADMKSQNEAVEHGKTAGLFEKGYPQLSFPAIQ